MFRRAESEPRHGLPRPELHRIGRRPLKRLREFFSVVPLGAVAVLAVNDHWAKARFPGLVTGKISDFAGCFLLPLFASAVLGLTTRWALAVRVGVGVVATTVFFGAIKSSDWAARLTCATMDAVGAWAGLGCGRIVADPWDLLALTMVPVAWWYARRVNRAVMESE